MFLSLIWWTYDDALDGLWLLFHSRSKDAPVKVEGSGNEAPKPLVVNVVVQPPPIVITVPQVIPGNNNNNTITGYQVTAYCLAYGGRWGRNGTIINRLQ